MERNLKFGLMCWKLSKNGRGWKLIFWGFSGRLLVWRMESGRIGLGSSMW